MKNLFNPIIIMSLLIAPNAFAIKLNTSLSAKAGFDSNPYRLNDQFAIQGSDFIDYQVKAKIKFTKKLSLSAKGDFQDYGNSTIWGDNNTLTAHLKYKAGKFYKQRGVSLNYKQKDKTYVSRLNGTTSIYSGQNLDDRYDYQALNINAFRNFKLIKRVYNQFELDLTQKDYTDYPQLDITDVDYQSFKFTDILTIKANKRNTHSLNLSYESRLFSNREQKDNKGDEIVGTEMIFNYLDFGYHFQYRANKRTRVEFNTGFTQRTDNGSGYYDSQKLITGISSNYKWHKSSTLKFNYRYSDFAYLREPEISQISNEEDFTSETKHVVKLTSTTRLPKFWYKQAYFEVKYSYTFADSNRQQYQYDRQIISSGLRISF